jgi:hypothetical protein
MRVVLCTTAKIGHRCRSWVMNRLAGHSTARQRCLPKRTRKRTIGAAVPGQNRTHALQQNSERDAYSIAPSPSAKRKTASCGGLCEIRSGRVLRELSVTDRRGGLPTRLGLTQVTWACSSCWALVSHRELLTHRLLGHPFNQTAFDQEGTLLLLARCLSLTPFASSQAAGGPKPRSAA